MGFNTQRRSNEKAAAETDGRLTLAAVVASPLTSACTQARDQAQDDRNASGDSRRMSTATPIKHVIVIIGENRTFDNVYGAYVPKRGQQVANLLSRGIVKADGAPGPNADAQQSRLATINPVDYFIDTNSSVQARQRMGLCRRRRRGAHRRRQSRGAIPGASRFRSAAVRCPDVLAAQLHTLSPVLEQDDLSLLTTGATDSQLRVEPADPPSPCSGPTLASPTSTNCPTRCSRSPARTSVRQLHRRHGSSLLPHVAAVRLSFWHGG